MIKLNWKNLKQKSTIYERKRKKIKREESKFINYFETNVATGNIIQQNKRKKVDVKLTEK